MYPTEFILIGDEGFLIYLVFKNQGYVALIRAKFLITKETCLRNNASI